MTITKALLLNIGVFEANASVRKSKGAFSLNYSNKASNVSKVELEVEAGSGFTWQPPITPTGVTMVRVTNGPIKVNVTLAEVAGVRVAPETVLMSINQFMILDDNVSAMTFNNQGNSVVSVAITQG